MGKILAVRSGDYSHLWQPLSYAKKAGGKKKKKKDDPKCKNSQECNVGGKKYCIPETHTCGGKKRARLDPRRVDDLRKMGGTFEGAIGGLKNGKKYQITPEMLAVANKLGVSQLQLQSGRVPTSVQTELRRRFNLMTTGETVTAPAKPVRNDGGVDVGGTTAKPKAVNARQADAEVGLSSVAFTRLDATTPPSKDSTQKVADMQAKALSKGYGMIDDIKDVPLDQLYPGVVRYLESLRADSNRSQNDILLVKNGDFYVTYFDDAPKLAVSLDREASVTQLVKDLPPFGQKSPIPTAVQFAGFPDHALGRYGADIVGAGFNIVIADPSETAQPPAQKNKVIPS